MKIVPLFFAILSSGITGTMALELNDDSAHLPIGGRVTIPVLANDSGPDDTNDLDWSSLAIFTPPGKGTLSLDPENGLITYTHTGSLIGSDSFEYSVADQEGTTATSLVTLNISEATRLPLLTSQMPAAAPPKQFATPDAFPGITFVQPLDLMTPPGESNRLFVIEKRGDIAVIPNLTHPVKLTFLDLDALVSSRPNEVFQSAGEQGLLGLAFHPDYANNGRFFVSYNLTIDGLRYQRLSQFQASASDPNAADPHSETVFIEQLNDRTNHNGGDLHFGPDGYLYMSWGDEGAGNDTLNNSQTITKDFWSSITRIDVDLEAEDGTPADGTGGDDDNLPPNAHPAIVEDSAGNPHYEVPADNPWVGVTTFNESAVNPGEVRSEFWAVGLRNPWRMSFDPTTGELWCGDVGQNAREEINLIVAGGNYEWAFREGNRQGPKWGEQPAGWTGGEGPVWEYDRNSGRSVTGGVVYRGTNHPELDGRYIFADYSSGNIWALDNSGASVAVQRLTGESGIAGFGYDPSNGDVLMADLNNGLIRRLTVEAIASDFPDTLLATGLFTSLHPLTPNPGLIPYDINLPAWSDHAFKNRWFGHPETGPSFTFSRDAAWTQPPGFLWVKHFELETDRGNPASRKRIETRVLVKTEEGSYGVSYRWNESGTSATLANPAGEEFDLAIIENGLATTQHWRIPSQAECATCHSPQAGHALSFNTRQLNRTGILGGANGNFLSLLESSGYLTGLTETPQTLPRHVNPQEADYSLEERARSWLDVNCAYCHSDSAALPAVFDARSSLTLFETGMIDGALLGTSLDPSDRLLAPGQEEYSAIIHRITARNDYGRMPPLSNYETDETAVQLLIDWIESDLPARKSYAGWRNEYFEDSADGDPDIDFDKDGRTNQQEFLTLSDPTQRDLSPSLAITHKEGNPVFVLPDMPGRRLLLEWTTNLSDWAPWPNENNNGLSRPAGQPLKFQFSADETAKFFRVRIEER